MLCWNVDAFNLENSSGHYIISHDSYYAEINQSRCEITYFNITGGSTANIASGDSGTYGLIYNEARNLDAGCHWAKFKDGTVGNPADIRVIHNDSSSIVIRCYNVHANETCGNEFWGNVTYIFWEDRDYFFYKVVRFNYTTSARWDDVSLDTIPATWGTTDSCAIATSEGINTTTDSRWKSWYQLETQYPWMWMANTSINEGIGSIYTHFSSIYPAGSSFLAQNSFPETEFTWTGQIPITVAGIRSQDVHSASLFVYPTNSSYTNINTLATSTWKEKTNQHADTFINFINYSSTVKYLENLWSTIWVASSATPYAARCLHGAYNEYCYVQAGGPYYYYDGGYRYTTTSSILLENWNDSEVVFRVINTPTANMTINYTVTMLKNTPGILLDGYYEATTNLTSVSKIYMYINDEGRSDLLYINSTLNDSDAADNNGLLHSGTDIKDYEYRQTTKDYTAKISFPDKTEFTYIEIGDSTYFYSMVYMYKGAAANFEKGTTWNFSYRIDAHNINYNSTLFPWYLETFGLDDGELIYSTADITGNMTAVNVSNPYTSEFKHVIAVEENISSVKVNGLYLITYNVTSSYYYILKDRLYYTLSTSELLNINSGREYNTTLPKIHKITNSLANITYAVYNKTEKKAYINISCSSCRYNLDLYVPWNFVDIECNGISMFKGRNFSYINKTLIIWGNTNGESYYIISEAQPKHPVLAVLIVTGGAASICFGGYLFYRRRRRRGRR